MNIKGDILTFLELVGRREVAVYNEFSLQHELGFHLRYSFPDRLVEFERNVSHFGFDAKAFIKRENDISVCAKDGTGLHAVLELKFPRNGQVPEQMFGFCKDVCFLEQMVEAGFHRGYFVALADDPKFYRGSPDGIYGHFRAGVPVQGTIRKPTGTKNEVVNIAGSYRARWQDLGADLKFCLLEIS